MANTLKKTDGYDDWFEREIEAGLTEADDPANRIELEDAMVDIARDLESYINRDRQAQP